MGCSLGCRIEITAGTGFEPLDPRLEDSSRSESFRDFVSRLDCHSGPRCLLDWWARLHPHRRPQLPPPPAAPSAPAPASAAPSAPAPASAAPSAPAPASAAPSARPSPNSPTPSGTNRTDDSHLFFLVDPAEAALGARFRGHDGKRLGTKCQNHTTSSTAAPASPISDAPNTPASSPRPNRAGPSNAPRPIAPKANNPTNTHAGSPRLGSGDCPGDP